MKPLYLDWNLGLGDAILCNGLVRWLAREHAGRHIVLPAYEQNMASVYAMFLNLDHIQVIQVGDMHAMMNAADANCDVLRVGLSNPAWGTVEPFDRAFYEFAGVPFDAKWDMFHVPESGTELRPGLLDKPYVLIHEDVKRGFEIDGAKIPDAGWLRRQYIPIFVEPKTPLITDWRYMIQEAAEIHCIDSSIMHLAELLPTTGKLYYHRYARSKDAREKVEAVFRKDWIIIE